MSIVKRFHYSPIWKIEKTEQWLQEMELSGYRLEKVSHFGMLYHFKPSKPKTVNYLFWFDGFRGDGMNSVADGLVRRVSANEIRTTPTTLLTLLRITAPCDLTFELDTRPIYLRVLIFFNFLAWLICNLMGSMLLYAVGWRIAMLFYGAFTGAMVVYYLYGLICIAVRISKINRKLKK